MTPNTGAYNEAIITSSISSLFDNIGEEILLTHKEEDRVGIQLFRIRDGDYIPAEPSENWVMDSWRVRLQMTLLLSSCFYASSIRFNSSLASRMSAVLIFSL